MLIYLCCKLMYCYFCMGKRTHIHNFYWLFLQVSIFIMKSYKRIVFIIAGVYPRFWPFSHNWSPVFFYWHCNRLSLLLCIAINLLLFFGPFNHVWIIMWSCWWCFSSFTIEISYRQKVLFILSKWDEIIIYSSFI